MQPNAYSGKSLLMVANIFVLAVFAISCQNQTNQTVVGNATAVVFEANASECSPKKIETGQGYQVKVALKNTGSVEVFVEFPDVPYKITALPGETGQGGFSAPTQPGRYKFTCGATAQPNEATRGELEVKNTP